MLKTVKLSGKRLDGDRMYIYEVWTCMDSSHEFAKQGTFLNRAAAESIAEVLRESGIYIKVWVEERYDPEAA